MCRRTQLRVRSRDGGGWNAAQALLRYVRGSTSLYSGLGSDNEHQPGTSRKDVSASSWEAFNTSTAF